MCEKSWAVQAPLPSRPPRLPPCSLHQRGAFVKCAFAFTVWTPCREPSPDMRQSAFALVGDLATYCIAHVLPAWDALMPAALACFELPALRSETMGAANNACWSLGEIIIRMDPSRIAAVAGNIAERTAAVLCFQGRMPSGILENCAIVLGRTAWRAPEPLAPHLGHFVGAWCKEVREGRR